MHSFKTRLLFLMVCLLMTSFIHSNIAPIAPIAVKANENTTVSIFFPSPIAKVIEPASHFSFTHEVAGNLATLKAKKGSPSNLTVITESGDIFSFALNYSEIVENFTFVISLEQAIGKRGGARLQRREAPIATSDSLDSPVSDETLSEDSSKGNFRTKGNGETSSSLMGTNSIAEIEIKDSITSNSEPSEDNYEEQGSFYDMEREGYYEIFCENSYLQRTIFKNNMRENSGVDLRLNHMAVDLDEIYFTLQFRNVSKSDYHIGNVRFYIKTLGNEELPMSPLFTYNLGGLIKQSGVNKFVYVFQEFKLGPDQRVYVVIDEKDGRRNIVLPLDVQDLRENLE